MDKGVEITPIRTPHKITTRMRLGLLSIIILWLSMSSLTIYTIYRAKNALEEEVVRRAMIVTQNLAHEAQDPLQKRQPAILNDMVNRARSATNEITSAAVSDSQGVYLAHTNPQQIGKLWVWPQGTQREKRPGAEEYTIISTKDENDWEIYSITLPIHRQNETLGAVHLGFSKTRVQEVVSSLRLGIVVVSFIAFCLAIFYCVSVLTIGSSELYEHTITDSLTGLKVQRYFLDRLEEEVARAEREGSSLAVIMSDVDDFKLVNDRHGHQVGSRVLQELGWIFLRYSRKSSVVCRYGGDEFTMLLPQTNAEGAKNAVLRLQERIRQLGVTAGRETVKVNLSFGIASYPMEANSAKELVTCADIALYDAKFNGKDRVCIYQEIPEESESYEKEAESKAFPHS
jgi:diguanylate cyclase (GGDEF)-like protein